LKSGVIQDLEQQHLPPQRNPHPLSAATSANPNLPFQVTYIANWHKFTQQLKQHPAEVSAAIGAN